MTLVITCGGRIDAKSGVRVELDAGDGPVECLRRFLAQPAQNDIWWSPFEWTNNRRDGSNWIGSSAVVLDVDYHNQHGDHVEMPAELVEVVLGLLKAADLPGNLAHLTPRGLRVVAILDERVDDPEQFRHAWRGFANQVRSTLRDLELLDPKDPAGLRVDTVVKDLARYFFLPNTAKPIKPNEPSSCRTAEVIVMRREPFAVLELTQHDQAASQIQRKTRTRALPPTDFAAAADGWVRDHPVHYPPGGTGTCPTCQHNGCFGQLGDDPLKWACFSAGHAADGGGVGTQRDNCWIGSSLDLEAHRRGCTLRDVLIADGYLTDGTTSAPLPARGSRQMAATTQPATATDADKRKRIAYEPKNLGRALDEVEAILAAEPEPQVFQSGGSLVRIVDESLVGQALRPVAKRISVAEAKALISDRVVFQTVRGRRQDLAVPDDLAKALVQRVGWDLIPKLTGIAMVPVMRSDGSLHSQAGYDARTGYFVVLPALEAISIPDHATRAEAKDAAEWILREVFGDFPFKEPHDKAALFSELMTGLLRPTLHGPVPAFLHSAPLRGTGKTLLVQLLALILLGERAAATQPPTDEAEWRKLLFAAALGGQPLLFFDNVPAGSVLKSSTLDMAITAGTIQDRHLGRSKTGSAALRSLIMFTGNNVRLGGDLPRRVIPIVLDSNEDRPERRTSYAHDPIEPWVIANRAAILSRLFTIARAFRQHFPPGGQGYDPGLPRFGGFEAWDKEIRGMVHWVGLGDAAGGVDALHQVADDDTMERAELLEVLREVFEDREFVSSEVHATASQGENTGFRVDATGRPVLSKEARLFQAVRQEGRKLTVNRVARLLGEHVDAPAGGLVLRRVTAPSGDKFGWRVAQWVSGKAEFRTFGESGDSPPPF